MHRRGEDGAPVNRVGIGHQGAANKTQIQAIREIYAKTDAAINIAVVPGMGEQIRYINTEVFGFEICESRGKAFDWIVSHFDIAINTPQSRGSIPGGDINIDEVGPQRELSIALCRQRQLQNKVFQGAPWQINFQLLLRCDTQNPALGRHSSKQRKIDIVRPSQQTFTRHKFHVHIKRRPVQLLPGHRHICQGQPPGVELTDFIENRFPGDVVQGKRLATVSNKCDTRHPYFGDDST